ncbi:MAG: Ig-like domain-containing protein, partial [Pseudomonadota bacterium]
MARLKFGSFRADDFQGSDRKDVFFGLRGNDTISGSGGSDLLIGGRGADQVFGGSGNDLLSGGSGHDTLTGGAGSDVIVGGSGRDLLIYQADQNLGSHDYYNGGRGKDTLRLELSKETWVSRAFQSDLASLLSGSASYSDGLAGQRFTFESLGLNVRRIEEIEIFVEGQQLNDVDDAVVAVDDTLTLTTDVETATGNVLLNDQVADLVTDVTVARQAQFGLVTTAPDGTFTYQLDTDASAVAALTKGETLTDSFEYTVRDADGDLATATV